MEGTAKVGQAAVLEFCLRLKKQVEGLSLLVRCMSFPQLYLTCTTFLTYNCVLKCLLLLYMGKRRPLFKMHAELVMHFLYFDV